MKPRWWLPVSDSKTQRFLGVAIVRASSVKKAIDFVHDNNLVDSDKFDAVEGEEIPDWVPIPKSFDGRFLRWNDCVALCGCLLDAWRDLPEITRDRMGLGFRTAIAKLVDVLAWNSYLVEKPSAILVQRNGSS